MVDMDMDEEEILKLEDEMVWLFSHGSNNPKQLSDRICWEVKEYHSAMVIDHTRVFGHMSEHWGGSVADFDYHPNENCVGYIAKVPKEKVLVLDYYEGCNNTRNHTLNVYNKMPYNVLVYNAKTDKYDLKTQALVYKANPFNPSWMGEFHSPSESYLRAIARMIHSTSPRNKVPEIVDIHIRRKYDPLNLMYVESFNPLTLYDDHDESQSQTQSSQSESKQKQGTG